MIPSNRGMEYVPRFAPGYKAEVRSPQFPEFPGYLHRTNSGPGSTPPHLDMNYSSPNFVFHPGDFPRSFRPSAYADEFSVSQEDFPALPMPSFSDQYPAIPTQAPSAVFNPNSTSFVPGSLSFDFTQGVTVTQPADLRPTSFEDDPEEKERKQYGLPGLFLLRKSPDPDLLVMALGKELNGGQEGSSKASHFLSPFSDKSLAAGERPEFNLPHSYFVGKPILRASHLQKFSLGTLFYIFYNMPGERLQALAAEDLCSVSRYRREWVYETNSMTWFLKNGGDWKTYDVEKWEVVPGRPPVSANFLSKDEVKSPKASQ